MVMEGVLSEEAPELCTSQGACRYLEENGVGISPFPECMLIKCLARQAWRACGGPYPPSEPG